jgi:hypothetical protein
MLHRPEFVHGIKDDNFRNWAIEINKLWFLLGKVVGIQDI